MLINLFIYIFIYLFRSSTIARLTEICYGTTAAQGLSIEQIQKLDDKRKSDVRLLKAWKIGTIIDLMVENEKQKYLIA